MHDIKWIKENIVLFDTAMKRRSIPSVSIEVTKLYESYVALLLQLQILQNERNNSSKIIGIKKAKGEDTKLEMEQVAKLKLDIISLQEKSNSVSLKIKQFLEVIPNIPSEDTPDGVNEESNKEIKVFGNKPVFPFKPLSHDVIGYKLNMMDFDKAADMSGARFVILKDKLALLERALCSFMLNIHTQKHKYIEISPPSLVRDKALFGTGQLPKFSKDLFKTNSDHWLIPTAEVPLTNIVADEIIPSVSLPIRYTALTTCFRSEAGSAGQDTKGMIRLHEFKKVELVSIVKAEDSVAEHERMLSCAEEILKQLELPYRVVILCCGDLGFSASKTYDIEVWLPSQNQYREISSCSNCLSFQSRRMNARMRNLNNDIEPVHTLNGSGVAVGRALLAILENYQNKDGSVNIPVVLKPYMNGLDMIALNE
ncbi:MAG TPA: serine--tRNA ligase [Alphaproteobacteria bacterium]|jgi:seryl-tRNA synthetase|nr:serine--tRNA ligase [Alphaproteobacteria bacterium]HIK87621.1 serine--tRNA ligase [Alphaproteobacteria bacterium]